MAEEAWSAERSEASRRSLRDGIIFSVVLHGVLVVSMMSFSSPRAFHPASVVTVDLVAAIPTPASAPSAPKSKPAAKPAPKPVPAKPKKVLLPKQPSPTSTKPRPAPAPPKPKPEEMEYDDALAQLRDELGEPTPAADAQAPANDAPLATPSSGSGRAVDKEIAAWALAARRHVRSVYVTPPAFLGRDLVTELTVRLSVTGDVLGTPTVERSSGDPFWDDNAVRALMRASPLPAPPESGVWPFAFPSVDR